MKTKIYGAGSIGNHLANAARTLGWAVDVIDIDEAALARMHDEIYPARYGAFDEEIGLYTPDNAPNAHYDFICIGTPPDTHLQLALEACAVKPKAILVEKPVATPDLGLCNEFYKTLKDQNIQCFTGYDHVIGGAGTYYRDLVGQSDIIGDLKTLDVEFREHWGGIFNAHPWLAGPWETYLGFWQRGGGATGEHSHAINLWQSIAHAANLGRIVKVGAQMQFAKEKDAIYDSLSFMNFETDTGFMGRCVQDVVTKPVKKHAYLQGSHGHLALQLGAEPGLDLVVGVGTNEQEIRKEFRKTRPDDFIAELKHIQSILENSVSSPIDIMHGLDTQLVIAAAYKSAQSGQIVEIDYNAGYCEAALHFVDREDIRKAS